MGRHSRDAWAARVATWRASGQSVEEFAAAVGVDARRLASWAERLGAVGGRRRKTSSPATALAVRSPSPAWVELMATTRGIVAASPALEVLVSGRVVRVPVGFDAETLRRIVDVMEGG